MTQPIPQLKTLAVLCSIAFLYNSGCKNNSTAPPVTPGTQGQYKIAYNSIRNGHILIYTMNADGTNQTQLTNDTLDFLYPEWSPDGKKIVFVQGRTKGSGIFTMNADGTSITSLPDSAGDDYNERAIWSPDGSKIVFVGGGISVMNSDGTNPHYLASGTSPVWSRDGSKIAFFSQGGFGDPEQIFVINTDGSNIRQLTNGSFRNWFPNWSPDGTKIVFESERDGDYEIYTMMADGTQQSRLTVNASGDRFPNWSPDGKSIAFVRSDSTVYVMNQDGTNQQKVTSTPPLRGMPSVLTPFPRWSPDGTKVLFVSGQICIVNPDGTNQKILTSGYDLYPAWSPVRY